MELIKGMHHAAIRYHGEKKYREGIEFYTKLLGFHEIRSWSREDMLACMLRSGSCIVELYSNGTDEIPHNGLQHIALSTDDVDACVAAVRSAGYEIIREPNDVSVPSEPPLPIRMAFCYGPAGEEIEFFCEK